MSIFHMLVAVYEILRIVLEYKKNTRTVWFNFGLAKVMYSAHYRSAC